MAFKDRRRPIVEYMETRNVELGRYQFAHVANRGSRRPNSTRVCSSRNDFRVSQEPTESCSFSPRNLSLFHVTLSRRRSHYHGISWCCHRTHISILLHESATPRLHNPTYLYFLTVLHAHLPPEKRTIRGIVCAVTLFVKHLY